MSDVNTLNTTFEKSKDAVVLPAPQFGATSSGWAQTAVIRMPDNNPAKAR